MTTFQKEVEAAQADVAQKNTAGAIRHYGTAAAIDEELTRGWSEPGTKVRSELTRLYIESGEAALGQDNPSQAVTMFQKALEFGPGNAKAEKLLQDAKTRKPGAAKLAPAPTPAAKPVEPASTKPAAAAAKPTEPAPAPAPDAPRKPLRSEAPSEPKPEAADGARRPLKPAAAADEGSK